MCMLMLVFTGMNKCKTNDMNEHKDKEQYDVKILAVQTRTVI